MAGGELYTTETNCRIAHNVGILLINSYCFAIYFQQHSSFVCSDIYDFLDIQFFKVDLNINCIVDHIHSFLYKNLFYKNMHEAENAQKINNKLRTC